MPRFSGIELFFNPNPSLYNKNNNYVLTNTVELNHERTHTLSPKNFDQVTVNPWLGTTQPYALKSSDLLTNKIMLVRLILLAFFVWPGVSMIYFSFCFNVSYLAGSPYVNTLISAILEFLIYGVSGWLVIYGRRDTVFASFVAGILFSILRGF